MFIKSIHLLDYKRFHDLTIDLGENPKRIIALVGPNGCGKSSVLDAIVFSLAIRVGGVGSSESTKDYHYYSLQQEPGYNQKNDKVKIMLDQGSFQDAFIKKGSVKRRTMVSFRSCFRYNSNLAVKEVRATVSIEGNGYGASNASALDRRIEENYRRLLAAYAKYRDENDLQPSAAKRYIIGQLNNALRECLDLEISSLGDIESDRGTLFFKKPDSDIVFQYEVLSAGEKEVVDILLDLFLRKDFYTDSIYIIDEPELHINTAIQRKLLTEINKMIPANCQIWIATHSIGFLRALQCDFKDISQIIEFKAENKWASEAYTLTPIVPNHQVWQNLFATALDDLSTLICPKIIIYCEGRAEPGRDARERGLDAQVYNTIFAAKYPDVLFVSSGGNTELEQRSSIAIAILSKVFQTLEILVLKDRDVASGSIASEQDRQMYLQTNPKNHRVLKRFEIENYLYDRSVLIAYCTQNGLTFDEAAYDKIVVDITNDNVKDYTGKIKNCCGIKTNIDPTTFKLCLAACITEDMEVYKELEEVIFQKSK